MKPYPKVSILSSLLDDPIKKLAVPSIVSRAINVDGRYKTVKDILFTTLDNLQEVYQIGPVRSRILRNAAEEYISG